MLTKTIGSPGSVVNRPQHIRSISNIFDRQLVINVSWFRRRAVSEQFTQSFVVLTAAVDGFFEDRRIAGDTAQAILRHPLFQPTISYQIAIAIPPPCAAIRSMLRCEMVSA
jgi:hypothetical protein